MIEIHELHPIVGCATDYILNLNSAITAKRKRNQNIRIIAVRDIVNCSSKDAFHEKIHDALVFMIWIFFYSFFFISLQLLNRLFVAPPMLHFNRNMQHATLKIQ